MSLAHCMTAEIIYDEKKQARRDDQTFCFIMKLEQRISVSFSSKYLRMNSMSLDDK